MIKLILEKCIACKLCEKACLFGGIRVENKVPILTDLCTNCGVCVDVCKVGAIESTGTKKGPVHNIEMYKNVFVIAEQREGVLQPVTLELLGKARELADIRGASVSAILIGDEVRNLSDILIQHGADRVFVSEAKFLNYYRTIPYERIISGIIEKYKPEVVLAGATTFGRDLAPRIANRFRTGLTADCTGLEISDEGLLLQTRPAFGGNIMATITTPGHRPQMSTVRPGVMSAKSFSKRKGEIVNVSAIETDGDGLVEILSRVKKEKKGVLLEKAEVIVSGGRGTGDPKNFKMLEELASLFSGQVGASRAVVDLGWIDHDHQVGQTGKTVKPRIYFACGISGAVQHLAGMQSSDIIIAINKDPQAPIFQMAHFCLVGDMNKIVPELISQLQKSS
jgi:caffeyl-CoA reductase-Etf complex subunit CarE